MFPCVPNTTSVTQETDILYGPFKSGIRVNLENLTKIRLEQANGNNKKVSIGISHFGLLVFGGDGLVDVFNETFLKVKCLEAWATVGAVPLTRTCCQSTQV